MLNTRRTLIWAAVAAPIFFGLVSMMLGQDSNWDLFNYHLYNPFALLHGKLDLDLAPAGFQTYFNPLLDVPYYVLNQHLPAPLIGFLMGFVHGLNFTLLLGITYQALPNLQREDHYRIPLLLAMAGCLTANFLSGIGNSMGDNTTTLFVLAALLIILSNWQYLPSRTRRAGFTILAAGLMVGLGVGLKLTNAVYMVALCAAWLFSPFAWLVRIRLAFIFGVGSLLGLAITGGFWFYEMGRTFGNPFFPQFSTFFPNALARQTGAVDTIWRPKGVIEIVLWPFIFALDSHRVGQLSIRQIIWPILYIALMGWLWAALRQRLRHAPPVVLEERSRYILACVVLGYLAWMALFSVYRYLVPVEVMAPLAVWLLLTSWLEYTRARRVAAWALTLCTLVVLAGGVGTWGHEPWAARAFRADTPHLPEPANATILMLGDDGPNAWLAQFFPPTVAVAGLGGNFPETSAYVSRVQALVAQRAGGIYTIVARRRNWRIEHVAKINAIVNRLGLTKSMHGCAMIRWTTSRFRLHARVYEPSSVLQPPGYLCSLGLAPSDERDMSAENQVAIAQAAQILDRYGFTLNANTCTSYQAFIGQTARPYQFCQVKRKFT